MNKTTILTTYKIRRPSDGKFKLGGMDDDWSKSGKTWSSKGAIKLHFSQYKQLLYPETLDEAVTRMFPDGAAVIEVIVYSDLSTSVREIPILDFINS